MGSGVYGHVYRGRDSILDYRPVAIKLFPVGNDLELAAYEARFLERIRGPKVVPVYDAGLYGDVPYLVTEVAPLGSLADAMPSNGVEPSRAIDLVRQVLVAVDVCHTRQVLHRDIKPSNAFLFSADDVRLGDFGVSAEMDANGCAGAHGDPAIRPPEACIQGQMDSRSDLYQVGVTLYHLLVGSNPFEEAYDLEEAIVERKFVDIADAGPHVPLDVAMRVRKAMAADPDQRYSNADEMHAALRVAARARRWCPTQPDPGVDRQWVSAGRGRRIAVRVLAATGNRSTVDTRYLNSGNRLRAYCYDDVTARALPRTLRGVFRDLS